ncbi:MAG TPA: ISNCY family transposase [Candidatus Hodarchaeales archaeon]|nr:ISNCY family transposase [Candidatus Hodarchaeales archaeon]
MGKNSKRDYFRMIYPRYRLASPAEKSRILDEFCKVCGYNRKHAIAKLNGAAPEKEADKVLKRSRRLRYDSRVLSILAAVWIASGYLCSVRLKAAVGLWLPWIRQRFPISKTTENSLLSISARQMDRRLQARKTKARRSIYGRTKPGTLLKHQIPIKTDHWDVTTPGFTEVDLVSHSGSSAAGVFVYSLNQTDILTTWVETRAVLGKSEAVVVEALDETRKSLPFVLEGIDSDNGSEFINDHLYRYCQKNKIQFTRGRPYKKDDNAHVEQKNWTHVRKLFGWSRYDSPEVVPLMNELYCKELRWFMNLFTPSMKL